MKSISVFSALLAAASTVSADSSISSCAQTCISNMLGLASSFGCDSNDTACLCKNQNFGYDLRDCVIEACGAQDLPAVQSYVAALCSSGSADAKL